VPQDLLPGTFSKDFITVPFRDFAAMTEVAFRL